MKKKVEKIKQIVKFQNSYSGHILLIIIGFGMAVGVLLKLLGYVFIDSDWFWFITGVGLGIEGIAEIVKQRKFDKKYRVVDRKEFERMMNKK